MEVWKDIKGYEGLYQVSNLGNVKSTDKIDSLGRLKQSKILKPAITSDYYGLTLYNKGVKSTRRIHQMVAESFLNHKSNGHSLVVNHIDLDKLNNKVSNLEIVTARENSNLKHIKSTSKYVGVHWAKDRSKWVASIRISGVLNILGQFSDELEASKAYQAALKQLSIE